MSPGPFFMLRACLGGNGQSLALATIFAVAADNFWRHRRAAAACVVPIFLAGNNLQPIKLYSPRPALLLPEGTLDSQKVLTAPWGRAGEDWKAPQVAWETEKHF